jgi:D-tyrosyl-tRNA(Tyr) deacylase
MTIFNLKITHFELSEDGNILSESDTGRKAFLESDGNSKSVEESDDNSKSVEESDDNSKSVEVSAQTIITTHLQEKKLLVYQVLVSKVFVSV